MTRALEPPIIIFMPQRCVPILLVILLILQMCVSGLSVCLDGGDCHAQAACTQVDSHGDDDHGHGAHLSSAHTDHCGCTDLTFAELRARPGYRAKIITSHASPSVALLIPPSLVAAVPFAPSVPVDLYQSDSARIQQTLHVRTCRLLL